MRKYPKASASYSGVALAKTTFMTPEHLPAPRRWPVTSWPSERVESGSDGCHSAGVFLAVRARGEEPVCGGLTQVCCFSALPCVVGEWSPWSGCADRCKPTTRVRRRPVQQEPRNGGAPCPLLEERAGCLEYSTPQGQDCGRSFGTGDFEAYALVVFDAFPSRGIIKAPVSGRESSMRCREHARLSSVDRRLRKCREENWR